MKSIFVITLIILTVNCSLETIGLRHKMSQLIQEHQTKIQQEQEKEKPMAGGWIKQSLDEFEQQNNVIIESTLKAIEEKFQLEEDGFKYDKLLQVTTQVVAGINYKVIVQYTKDNESRIFEVIQYVVPWNTSANKITSVEELITQQPR